MTQELLIACDSGLPVLLFHNLTEDAQALIRRRLPLPLDLSTVPGFQDARHLPTDILTVLERQQEIRPTPGWIQQRDFDTINRNIEGINSTIARIDAGEEAVNAFVDRCDGELFRQAFMNYVGVITPKPDFGTQTRFVSQETPFQRLALPAAEGEASAAHSVCQTPRPASGWLIIDLTIQ